MEVNIEKIYKKNVKIFKKIGEGNFGAIYLGSWNNTQVKKKKFFLFEKFFFFTQVALKSLKGSDLSDFKNEATLLLYKFFFFFFAQFFFLAIFDTHMWSKC